MRFRAGRLVPAIFAIVLLVLLAGCRRPQQLDSVVLVTIDTLRADHVSCYGPSPAATPNLDALAASGARAEHAWTTVPLTTPAHASILTGLYPPAHGVRNNARFRLPDSVTTLAEIYRREGRRTAAFVASFTTSSYFGLQQGFDTFDDDFGQDDEGARRSQRQAHEVVARAARWVRDNGDRPFFLWVHLYDPHVPYAPPPEFARRYPGDPYSGEVAFADDQVGRLMRVLDETGAASRAVVVALSDHGEGLGTHGEPEHGLLLYEETLRVPLIVRAPGRVTPGTVIKDPVSVVDVAPTLLALTAIPPERGLNGRDLFGATRAPAERERLLYAETLYPHEEFGWSALYALRSGASKYIESTHPELYDLAADPHETKNLRPDRAADAKDLSIALRHEATGLVDRARLAAAAGFGGDANDDTIARLASLGYVAGGGGPAASADDPLPAIGGPDPVERMEDYRLFSRAGELVNAGQAPAAIDIYRKLVQRDRGNPQLLLKLAGAEERAGRSDAAQADYAALLERHPTFYLGYRAYSDFLEKHDRARESRALWIRLQGLLPGYVGIEVRLAQAEIAAGLADVAAKRLEAYLDGRPDDPDGWALLGQARVKLGRPDAALDAFRRTLERHPTNPVAVDGAVKLLLGRGDRVAARQLVQGLVARDPADPMLRRMLASL